MPQYNGVVSYAFEVLLHLLWSYVVFAILLCVVLPAPLVLLWAFGGNGMEVALGFLILFASAPAITFGWVHLAVFTVSRVYFLPRFPYAPASVTLLVAIAFGSILLALAAYVPLPFGITLESDASATARAFERMSLLERVGFSGVLSAFVAAVGAFFLSLGGTGPYTYGLAKWLGWLIIGREAFDAFVERETAKLSREYDEYVKSIRKR
ncbi:MAG: hypothetical protein JNK07_04895 [Alphaproteobacteria bacterium]|nr:hypothetical protein [Alphaproteobacteria bacterium]